VAADDFAVVFSANHDNVLRVEAAGLTRSEVEAAIVADIRLRGRPAAGDWLRGMWPTVTVAGIVIEYRPFTRAAIDVVNVGSYRPVGYDEGQASDAVQAP
jgi:hypothetical protein